MRTTNCNMKMVRMRIENVLERKGRYILIYHLFDESGWRSVLGLVFDKSRRARSKTL